MITWIGFAALALALGLWGESPKRFDGLILGTVWYVYGLLGPV